MRISTSEVPVRDQAGYWQSVIERAFVPLEFVPTLRSTGFRAELAMHQIDGLDFARLRSDAHAVTRTPGHIRRGGEDVLFAMIPRRGTVNVSQDERIAELGPGDIATYDPARPCTIAAADAFDMSIAKVPASCFAAHGLPRPGASSTAVRIDASSDLGCLISPYLARMSDLVPSTATLGIQAATVELLSAALAGAANAAPVSPAHQLRVRAQRLIREQLGDPALDPRRLCAQLHVSLRTLQLAFAEAGTSPARWIKRCRLDRAADLLARPSMADRSVTEIAFAVGFRDSSHFSRAFKHWKQMSPRAFRGQQPDRTARTD